MAATSSLKFIDVFAGCGGLSLGLTMAGCRGVFAIEKSDMAFETLRENLVDGEKASFDWPEWLPKKSMTCENLINGFAKKLADLAGKVDLIVGGPPCQGFSTAGKRDPADPRNKMTEQYLSLVGIIRPRFLVIENVAGFNMQFDNEVGIQKLMGKSAKQSYAEYVAAQLDEIGYRVHKGLINCADFGVPQNRQRFLMLCERKDVNGETLDLINSLNERRGPFLRKRGLPINKPVSSREAISDLETKGRLLISCTDSDVRGFQEAAYDKSHAVSAYQKLMRKGARGKAPNSRRLPKHRPETLKHFERVRDVCRPGKCLSIAERALIGTKKHTITVLDGKSPSPTVTTLPDDILHYKEPRILTVRENARLQSFPDWFAFKGKYTTGGKKRKFECPRYTQVGNAVPPLVAEAIGETLIERRKSTATKKGGAKLSLYQVSGAEA